MPVATTTAPAPAPHLVMVAAATAPDRAEPPVRATVTAAAPAVPPPAPEAGPAAPLLRVEHGTATAEEIAAVITVLLARAVEVRAAAEAEEVPASRRAAARWRAHAFAGPRAWTADARDLLAG